MGGKKREENFYSLLNVLVQKNKSREQATHCITPKVRV